MSKVYHCADFLKHSTKLFSLKNEVFFDGDICKQSKLNYMQ